MKSFKKFLLESLDKAYDWKWLHKNSTSWEAEFFDKENGRFVITFVKWDNGKNYEVVFSFNESHANTNFHDSFRVLATVTNAMITFLKEFSPPNLFFTGRKDEGKARIYAKILQHFKSDFLKVGYKIGKIDHRMFFDVLTLIKEK